MKKLLTLALIFSVTIVKSQSVIDWNEDYELQLSDFQPEFVEIGNGYRILLNTATSMSFQFQMSNIEFMFTKNFNPLVDCSFNGNAATLIAHDSAMAMQLLNFANYDFDLSELYARKFRKRLWEEKGAFTNPSFFQPIFNELQEELSREHNKAVKLTELGIKEDLLVEMHLAVINEIKALSDFCKTCKPPKKKK